VAKLTFFFDYVCPYAYLASREVERLARDTDAELKLEPVLLGGIFRSIGAPDTPVMATPKAVLNEKEIARWSRRRGVVLKRPADHPRRTVLALRATHAAPPPARSNVMRALFETYWRDGLDLEDPKVVQAALDGAGIDGASIVSAAGEAAAKDALRGATDHAVEEGVFGVPTFLVERSDGEKEIFWGQDRLSLVHRALRTPKRVDFFFDFSSPYAYLASTQVRALVARTGAAITYRPVLLGALFKTLGTPNVPLFAMPESKQRYNARELSRYAEYLGVHFKFASAFPMNTVKALRLVLVTDEAHRPNLIDALFRALWSEDRDISNDDELRKILASASLDTALLDQTSQEGVKMALRDANDVALSRGVFGVPTFAIDGELFWGQDRLREVERAIIGDFAMDLVG
jgi:2-hydroxychromene-2-carboxylate isomerase